MASLIRNLTKIRIHGQVFYYFEAPNHRDDWRPIGYAHGRRWRIVDSWESGLGNEWVTYKCQPINERKACLDSDRLAMACCGEDGQGQR